MARTRNLKPGFFKNEHLGDLQPEARLLFAGLWCWADRDGRLEDRPRRLKAEILPYDDCDVEGLLQQLADSPGGFIVRYEIDGNHYISIPAFGAHQSPHRAEKSGGIPAPPGNSTRQAPDKHHTSRALTLKPSALTLKPSALTLKPSASQGGAAAVASSTAGGASLTVEELANKWNTIEGVCDCRKISKDRRKAFRERCRDSDWLSHVDEALALVDASNFCKGGGERDWKADFDWFLKPKSITNLLEGKYSHGKSSGTTATSGSGGSGGPVGTSSPTRIADDQPRPDRTDQG